MKKTTVAVIGCGAIASGQHIPAYTRSNKATIKYLVDFREQLTKDLAEQYQVPHTTTDYQTVLDDPEVDAVSICTPNATHAEIAIAALNAGKHVLCEKPAAINIEQVREMQEAAERNQRMLCIGVVNRFNTSVNKIKDMIDAGELGNVYHIYCSFRAHRSIPGLGGQFTTKAASGGGVLIDWGVHFLDIIFYALGEPKIQTVSGAIYNEMAKNLKDYAYVNMWAGPPNLEGTNDVEDFVTGLVRTEGPTINLNGAWAQNIGESAMFIEFLGDKAGVKLEYGGDFKIYSSKNGALYETSPSFAKKDMFDEEIDGFIESITTNTKNRAHIDNVLITSEVMDALYRSAAEGKEVQL